MLKAQCDIDRAENTIGAAQRQGALIPRFAQLCPGGTLEHAYQVQDRVAALAPSAGYKAALTTAAARARFGAQQRQVGKLLRSGRNADGATLQVGRGGIIEAEVALVLAKAIDTPMTFVQEFRPLVKQLMPAVELPSLPFADGAPPRLPDLLITNLGSADFVLGAPVAARELSPLRGELIQIRRNGQLVRQAFVRNSIWRSGMWLVNEVLRRGWILKKGDVLLLGSLANTLPAEPGTYHIDYGRLGEVSFTLTR